MAIAAGRALRIVVMGTGPFAVPLLETLLASGHAIVAVVTRPDHAPAGRRPPPNPVRDVALRAGLPILAPERIGEPSAAAALVALEPDLLVVCDFGQILPASILALTPLGGLNLHGSLLPRHRGAAPVQWAIRSGDTVTGASVIAMTPALDAGRVLAAATTPIGARETAADLEARLARLGAPLVLEAIERLRTAVAAGADPATVGAPQDPALATRAPRLSKADGVVDWGLPAAVIERTRRALEPWPRSTTVWKRPGQAALRLVLDHVDVVATERVPEAPGTVLDAGTGRLVVACGEGTAIEIHRLVPEGRRPMAAADFLRGHLIPPGTVLG